MAVSAIQEANTRHSAKPTPKELIERARAIGVLAREQALQTEKQRHVSAELIGKMRDAELFVILQPERFGGFEYGYDLFVELVAAIAAGDGSTGWVYSLGAVHSWILACYPEEAQQEVWSSDRNAIAAGSYAPSGKAVPDKDGYRLSGRFSFASGVDNANWGLLGGMIPFKDGPKPGFFLVPRSQFSIHDDWHTMGFAGTGSKTIVVDDQFVPAYRTVTFADLLTGTSPGAAVNPNPLYRQPMLGVVPYCLVSPALGMARGALAAFKDQAAGRTTRGAVAGGNNKMSDFITVQMRIAEATASIDAAELLIHRDIRETFAVAQSGKLPDLNLRMRNRLNHAFATKLLIQAVDAVFQAVGGSALGLHHPVQRFWRDIHAAGSHISLNWDSVSAMYGQHVFGLEPRGQY
ncbi:MAG TPA: flavin-dependent monooxygenase [Burkholderiaceae bacterium]|nr:flavin-dependent monooxygenase [Burkholderiaceae bacterium]